MNKNKDEKFIDILKLIAPGTEIRQGLANILRAKTGALIVVGDSKEVLDIVDSDMPTSKIKAFTKYKGIVEFLNEQLNN